MKANVTYKQDNVSEPSSFVVTGDRTRWYFNAKGNGVVEFSRVEVDKDDHATETSVVLFGGEWDECMGFVECLPFVDRIEIQESLD